MTANNDTRQTEFLGKAEVHRLEMEELASKLKELVLSQPPEDLLGYLWGNLLLHALRDSKTNDTPDSETESEKTTLLFTLEYLHAIFSCFDEENGDIGSLNEGVVKEIVEVAAKLREVTLFYCIVSSSPGNGAVFGDETGRVEYTAKTTWTIIRGNRYQVLEGEFFRFILEPHDDALYRAYGIRAQELATGIQEITNSTREGFNRTVEKIDQGMEQTNSLADKKAISFDEAIVELQKTSPETITTIAGTFEDLFRGGLCNLSRHTKLPVMLLEDLSFKRGENKEFYATGPFCGTPLRTHPARIKPLIQLDDGFYAPEPFFIRDSAYRAIQRGLIKRVPGYREEWNRKQKVLTEEAFPRLFVRQLEGAAVLNEVYYKDPATGQWFENDTLIILDDVILLVEAKAGLGAMQSPATNFGSHVRVIQNLVVNAYRQAKRFFDYINSVPEAILYKLRNGEYIENRRIRLSEFRLVIPIGLTVESFSPFSAMCKELPEIVPLLGKYPFISISIDDLFVLNRFLPTTGELFHYLEVRQQVAAIRGANLFDELDHLGAYISENRFDLTLRDQFADGASMVTWDGSSEQVDKYFEEERWLNETPPCQPYPEELSQTLKALAKTRASGWLKIDALIRNFGSEARTKLADMLKELVPSLRDHDRRWFIFGEAPTFLIWLCRDRKPSRLDEVIHQAEIAALAIPSSEVHALRILVTAKGDFMEAQGLAVRSPLAIRTDFPDLMSKAKALQTRIKGADITSGITKAKKKPRPNELCWCGSGRKFKKCHMNL